MLFVGQVIFQEGSRGSKLSEFYFYSRSCSNLSPLNHLKCLLDLIVCDLVPAVGGMCRKFM